MDVPRSKAKVGVPGYVRCKRVRRPFTSDVPRYIVWANTRARYILWAGYIYAWFVHGLIWVDPDRAYIMHARADESTEHNRLDYYWTFYAISVALNCAHHEWVTVHLLPIHLDTVVPRGMYCDRGEVWDLGLLFSGLLFSAILTVNSEPSRTWVSLAAGTECMSGTPRYSLRVLVYTLSSRLGP